MSGNGVLYKPKYVGVVAAVLAPSWFNVVSGVSRIGLQILSENPYASLGEIVVYLIADVKGEDSDEEILEKILSSF